MTYDTRFTVAFAETPALDELIEFGEAHRLTVTPDLTEDDLPSLQFEKAGYALMALEAVDEGDEPVFEWAFEPGNELYSGDTEAVKEAIRSHFG